MNVQTPDDQPPASGEKLTLMHTLAWSVLVLAVAALVGAAIYKKMHPPELQLGKGAGMGELSGNTIKSGSDAPKPEDLAVWGEVKGFKLIDQAGKPLEAKDLLGEVWVANFVFTRCAGTCPQMTRAMADLNKELADLPQVKLITFSMDPEHDTPEVLTKYALKSDAVTPRWKFLSGDKNEMYRVTRDEFQLVVKAAPENADEPIIHSSKFVLVDAEGKIRGRFDGLSQDGPNMESLKKLAASVRKLRAMTKPK